MKKNISINISGIIFHIEEDGYEPLKMYLDSINRYFSAFDDSHEIIADIEGRIAEIFLSKLKNGKQVITFEDVNSLISTMGSIRDFQAAEEGPGFTSLADVSNDESDEQSNYRDASTTNRLYRDLNRKLLGGVLSGIAYYFNIDALWVRLFYILLFFIVNYSPTIIPILFIFYVLMWIIVPGNSELKNEKRAKKMFRNPEGKVLGGVAGGMAAYFGVDVVLIRLLFVGLLFAGGAGLILYIILWIILPVAKTITDKMEMEGQPVTLSNIESTVKKSLNVKEGEENLIVKILLFPFRLIAAIFDFLGKSTGPLLHFFVEALRVIIGIILIIIGISVIVALIVATGVFLGVIAAGDVEMIYNIPLVILKEDIRFLPGIALLFTLIIPFMVIAIVGFSIALKRLTISSKLGWSILAVWVVAIAVLSASIPPIIRQFNTYGQHSSSQTYDLKEKVVVLRANKASGSPFSEVSMNIREHDEDKLVVETSFQAVGRDREDAVENARMLSYNFTQNDSILVFDTGAKFKENARYRVQELTINMLMPKGQKFIIEPEMRVLLGNYLYRKGFRNDHMSDDRIWEFDDNGLNCLNCELDVKTPEPSDSGIDLKEIRGYFKTYDIANFYELEIGSHFDVKIRRGDAFEVIVNGRQSDVKNVEVTKNGDRLNVHYKGDIFELLNRDGKLRVYISVPELSKVHFSDNSKANIAGFSSGLFEAELKDAAFLELDIKSENLKLNVQGKSKLVLSGTGNMLDAKVDDGAKLFAYDFKAEEASIETNQAASVRVFASQELKVLSRGASNVRYRGDAVVEIDKNDGSSVKKD
ncbi:MAG: PspC domain-containing protein [Cyclobacteriaceae bacterium]